VSIVNIIPGVRLTFAGLQGTGKTHTIALSLLRLIDVQKRLGKSKRQIVFLTAMTHAAIQACLNKLTYLIECYRGIRGLPVAWLDDVKVEHVLNGTQHPPPANNARHVYIYSGTVYQVREHNPLISLSDLVTVAGFAVIQL
jgi:hypothetical protein